MADNNFWRGNVSDDWAVAGNWSLHVPLLGEIVQILAGARAIMNCPGPGSGVNYGGFELGSGFAGRLGTSPAPLYLGTVPQVRFNGRQCRSAYLNVDTGDTVARCEVLDTGPDGGLQLAGPGTITALEVQAARQLVLGPPLNVTLLRVIPDRLMGLAAVTIAAGANVATAIQCGGQVQCEAAIDTRVQVSGGIWTHAGSSEFNIPLVEIFNGGVFRFWSAGGTIGEIIVHPGGHLDLDGGTGEGRVITKLTRWGTVNRGGLGQLVEIGTYNPWGGAEQAVGAPLR